MTARRIPVPDYPELDLTEPMVHLLRVVHDFDQGARSDTNGRRENVYHPGPSQGQTGKALVARHLLRYACPSNSDLIYGLEATAAGCAVLAALRPRA